MAVSKRDVVKYPHHEQLELCTTRAAYRQGKKLTAVKVYTVNNESQHLLLCGVPSLGIQEELKRLCSRFGDVKSIVYIPQYSDEQFTDAYHVQYTRIQSARFAKRKLDCRSFYGGVLHVCYAPEMESVKETRTKLIQRRKEIATRTRGDVPATSSTPGQINRQPTRSKKHPALPLTVDRLEASDLSETSCVWKGIPIDIDPRTKLKPAPELLKPFGPQLPDSNWCSVTTKKRKLFHNEDTSHDQPSTSSSTIMQEPHVGGMNAVDNKTTAPSRPRSQSNFPGPVLKLVPRQVKGCKKILYRNQRPEESDNKEGSSCLDDANRSLEETIKAVRAKIRSVSSPNMHVILERKDQTTK